MGVLSGNPKTEPMHYGEVFTTWSFLAVEKGLVPGYQTLINHTGDQDLRKLLEEMIHSILKPQISEIENLLKTNGIALPPAQPEKPIANLESIPAGARFTDPEISAMLSKNIAEGLVSCSTVIGQCIREDIAALFQQFHMKYAEFALRLLRLNKEKGWLIPPPLHMETPEPAHV